MKTAVRYVIPHSDFGGRLLEVEKPARYSGGEYGRLAKKDAAFQMLIAFPDLYEIGMSNQALRIIYNNLNKIDGISCDRAFAPAPDFEKLLRETNTPLYGLDTGISFNNLDVLMFTLGYELGAGGVLNMLDISNIPIMREDRTDNDPIVIAGGPVVSNPLPYSPFIDAFWIGEGEAGFFELAADLAEMKKNGEGRHALLERITQHPHVWAAGKEKAVRAIDDNFTSEQMRDTPVFPVAGMKIVHSHGALEIMRGCPNGCRFCHAGFWYRPMRQKQMDQIAREVEAFVVQGGYREISLSSLSSGDYAGVSALVEMLNNQFSSRHVSFQMPSLKVSGFSLAILEQISQTRKSGLTFAVETPLDAWQLSLNKEVSLDSVTQILAEAKKHGWRGAKFYFMIGLPQNEQIAGAESEEKEIVNFIEEAARRARMHFNINVGIFVPKPHTPYQWASQIDSETAAAKLDYIRARLKPQGHKVSIADPLIARIEGVLSRGDARVGRFIVDAWRKGSRLDAWSEYMLPDVWRTILEENRDLADEILAGKECGQPLPWQSIHSGVSQIFLQKEMEKSLRHELTAPCDSVCETQQCCAPCGICSKKSEIIKNTFVSQKNTPAAAKNIDETAKNAEAEVTSAAGDILNAPANKADRASGIPDAGVWRMLFSFCKEGSAVYYGHLDLLEIFSMSLNRAELPVTYTQGFNPLIKLEIASPIATGIRASAEIAALEFAAPIDKSFFIERLNASLPEGISIGKAEAFFIPGGKKKHSLASLLWGFCYGIQNIAEYTEVDRIYIMNSRGLGNENADSTTTTDVYLPASGEKQFRQEKQEHGITVFGLHRKAVLAKNLIDDSREFASYFDVYRFLYP